MKVSSNLVIGLKALAVGASLGVLGLAAASPGAAQTPAAAPSGPRAPAPTVFPAPGVFPTTEAITLIDADPQAKIHYTLDGSPPTADSPLYDPQKLLFLYGVYDGAKGLKSIYTLRAIATRSGMADSDPSTFLFTIDRRDHTAYVSEQLLPDVKMIRDADNDKMFLLSGAKSDVLIDSGMGTGDLGAYIDGLRNPSKPLFVIFTHNHGDHIGQADKFVAAHDEYITEPDKANLVKLLQTRGVAQSAIDQHVKTVADQQVLDIGDRKLKIFLLPGHTQGAIAIFDDKDGYLFTGDAVGSNSPTIPDAAWMQNDQVPVDVYWSYLRRMRTELAGKVKYLMTGHNDRPLTGETYLDNVEACVRALLDKGDAATVPSQRPPGLKQVIVGDRLTDANWASINVNAAHYLPAPVDQISRLVELNLTGAALDQPFVSSTFDYQAKIKAGGHLSVTLLPASSRAAKLTVNGKTVQPGKAVAIGSGPLRVTVTAPDGKTTSDYHVTFKAG